MLAALLLLALPAGIENARLESRPVGGSLAEALRSVSPSGEAAWADDCPIDAESRRLVWFDDVRPAHSVGWLRQQAVDASGRLAGDALGALAYHETPEAVPALVSLARAARAAETRGESEDPRALALFEEALK